MKTKHNTTIKEVKDGVTPSETKKKAEEQQQRLKNDIATNLYYSDISRFSKNVANAVDKINKSFSEDSISYKKKDYKLSKYNDISNNVFDLFSVKDVTFIKGRIINRAKRNVRISLKL